MFFSLLPQALGVVEKWESWFLDFHFSTTHNLILRFFRVISLTFAMGPGGKG